MMTQQIGFSIVSAPLAAIDRRALSQAWYSALHLAKSSHGPAPAPLHAVAPNNATVPLRVRNQPHAQLRNAAPYAPARRARHLPRGFDSGVERRSPRSLLARRIERCFLDPARRVPRASFLLESNGTRVHVALAQLGGRMQLVAVCVPSARERVARALDEARYALAARGIVLDVDVRGARA
jgi:hypothetical protein